MKYTAQNRSTRFLISSLAALMLAIISPIAATAIIDFPIGYSSRGGAYAFIALVDQQQLLEQEGIRANFIYVGGPQISHALISGDIRMAILGPVTPLRAAAQGTDIRFIGGVTERESASLMADPKIAAAAGLKGTRLAIDRLGDTSDFRARKVLASTTVSLTLIDHIAAGTSKEFFDDRRSQAVAQCSDGVGHVTLRALGCREVCNLGVGESLLIERSFF